MKIDRRKLLKHGSAIGAVGWLNHVVSPWIAEAQGQELGNARRFGVLYSHFGWQTWNNAQRNSDFDFRLPRVFNSLDKYRDDMLLITGLYTERSRGFPHGSHFHLSDGPMIKDPPVNPRDQKKRKNRLALGPSIDRYIGNHLGKNAPYKAIHVNTWTRTGNGAPSGMAQPITDGEGEKQKVAPWTKPEQTHAALFNGNKVEQTVDLLSRRASVLDFINDRIKTVNAKLASSEKAKLEQFTESIRSVEQRIANLGNAQSGCGDVGKPGGAGGSYNSLGRAGMEAAGEAGLIQAELAAHALACGITPSAAVGVDRTWDASAFGVNGKNNHGMQHQRQMSSLEPHQEWRFSHIVRMLDTLNQYQEANGTAADSTILMYTDSTCYHPKEAHHQGVENMALAIFGDGGGLLKKGAWIEGRPLMAEPEVNTRDIMRPTPTINDRDTSMSEVFLGIVQAMGIKTDVYGEKVHCRGPMKGMFA